MNKFDILFNELMNSVITEEKVTEDTFEFDFNKDERDNVTCTFDILNADNKLLRVNTKINANDGKIVFNIENKELDEKTFMMKYYKDYERFKKAYKDFQAQQKPEEPEKKTPQGFINANNRQIPGVKSFNDKLSKINKNKSGENIKVNGTTFNVKYVNDDIKNLIQMNFSLVNSEPKKDELEKYDVIGIVKIKDKNSVPLKFKLINPDDSSDVQEWTQQDFAARFKDTFKNFKEALTQFEKTVD